jgi:hypothetical protein
MPWVRKEKFKKPAFVHSDMKDWHDSSNVRRIFNYAGQRLLEVFVIVAFGFSVMYFSADSATAICVGVGYLIAIGAIMLVMLADDYDRRLRTFLKTARR